MQPTGNNAVFSHGFPHLGKLQFNVTLKTAVFDFVFKNLSSSVQGEANSYMQKSDADFVFDASVDYVLRPLIGPGFPNLRVRGSIPNY